MNSCYELQAKARGEEELIEQALLDGRARLAQTMVEVPPQEFAILESYIYIPTSHVWNWARLMLEFPRSVHVFTTT